MISGFKENRLIVRLATAWLLLWFGSSALARLFTSTDHQLERALTGPSLAHPLGFDAFGQDLLLCVLRGAGLSAGLAGLTVFITVTLGSLLGSGISLLPGKVRFASLRILDFLLAFPALLLALGLAAITGAGWLALLGALLLGVLPAFVRLSYARAREVSQEDYVLAARSLGASTLRILRFHVAPQLWSIIRAKLPFLLSHAILAEATLSFLGVGVPTGEESWGALLGQGRDYLLESPHIAWGTGLPLFISLLAFQVVSKPRDPGLD